MIGFDQKMGARKNSRKMLRSVGVLPTSNRMQIAYLVLRCQKHVTAGDVCEQLNVQSGHVSIATVYNTLKLLVDHGLLRQIMVEASRVFYDSNISPHHHFFDTETGVLKDIEKEQFKILGMPEPPLGKSVVGVDIVVRLKSTD